MHFTAHKSALIACTLLLSTAVTLSFADGVAPRPHGGPKKAIHHHRTHVVKPARDEAIKERAKLQKIVPTQNTKDLKDADRVKPLQPMQ